MDKLKNLCIELLRLQHFSHLAVSIIDFKKKDFICYESVPRMFFDLASITKPLTLAALYHKDLKIFTKDMLLLLNHKAGLPVGGRLSQKSWREQILSYEIKESETSYSDYSALRLMLEIEKKTGKKLYDLSKFYFDDELKFWKDFFGDEIFPPTGVRKSKVITGEVNDDNAYTINEFCSHAGLFATISGLSKSLLNLDKETSFLKKMKKDFDDVSHERFLNGWDTVESRNGIVQNTTLAGVGCSEKTFGHLGFTGTSVWIDTQKERGIVILTNATEKFWYDRKGLNQIRRDLGSFAWNLS